MFEGHNPYLVALSVVIAILGGYTGFGLAARVRGTPGASRRLLLAGAAFFLAVGIWTMHFIGVLAAPLPAGTTYLVLPTIVSFLICALVVGVSLFFVSIGEPSGSRVIASALLLGTGIVSMHYVGIHGLAGPFHIHHDPRMMLVSALIAVGTAYGGLRILLARQVGMRLALSAVAFGFAVSGMHYTAMYGMQMMPSAGDGMDGLTASPQILALVVSLLSFLVVAGFLLFLVPESQQRAAATSPGWAGGSGAVDGALELPGGGDPLGSRAKRPLPLHGLGQPPLPLATRLPVEGVDGMHFVEADEIRGIRADAHYTLVHDGTRERMSPWSISEAESQLDPSRFMRVHRSHIISVAHVVLMRKEGDGAVVELDGAAPHLVPVSRARIAELRARLGLLKRHARGAARPKEGQSA
ncbi:MAG: carbon monoxide dehydrogenase [Hyphomicrobiales bacterium]|nr:MAG: carbon monoxide dehydrogenase [Hyphomicrobiales bacterium]